MMCLHHQKLEEQIEPSEPFWAQLNRVITTLIFFSRIQRAKQAAHLTDIIRLKTVPVNKSTACPTPSTNGTPYTQPVREETMSKMAEQAPGSQVQKEKTPQAVSTPWAPALLSYPLTLTAWKVELHWRFTANRGKRVWWGTLLKLCHAWASFGPQIPVKCFQYSNSV